jgi:hypothetical protein
VLGTRPELNSGEFLGAPTHAIRDVRPIDSEVGAIPIDAADDDVRVRVGGVVVVDGDPLEPASEVLLHSRHEAPHVRGHIEVDSVLGRDDKPELALLPRPRLPERVRWNRPVGTVQHSLASVPLDAIAFDVPEVQ